MAFTSKTGLMESKRKPVPIVKKMAVNLFCNTKKAPFILRPFAGLYNPFSYACSILCNHPADAEIKDVVKRAKDALTVDGKNDLMDELDTLKGNLNMTGRRDNCVDFVQEELFRRYTDTDSRPLTPAPTLASAVSRSSMKRRCLTPDHPPAPKQTLVLDLRRCHSQETLFWHGVYPSDLSSGLGISSEEPNTVQSSNKLKPTSNQMPPIVSPVRLSKRAPAVKGNVSDRGQKVGQKNQLKVFQATKNSNKNEAAPKVDGDKSDETQEEDIIDNVGEEEQLAVLGSGEVRRRGRRRKGRSRLMSAVLITTQNDPETQIAGIGSESHNPSSRESIVANDELEAEIQSLVHGNRSEQMYTDSFLQPELLEYLHREVDHLAIETEFDSNRRIVLEEAYRTRSEKIYGKEMQTIIKDFAIPPVSLNKWLHIPRIFSRRNAVFSLPIDRRKLDGLLPMQYISQYVKVSSSKKLLYRTVLEKYNNKTMYINLENLVEALKMMMGEDLDDENAEKFKQIMKWDDLSIEQLENLVEKSFLETENSKTIDSKRESENETIRKDNLFAEFDSVDEPIQEDIEEHKKIHFRTWCGLCGLCERLYANLPPIQADPPQEVEVADFDTLQGKLITQKVDDNLAQILQAIQNSHTD